MGAKEQVSSDSGGEVAIFHLGAGMHYGLDELGTRIWELIREPRTVGDVKDLRLAAYEVAPERCERDLLALVQKLADERLLEILG